MTSKDHQLDRTILCVLIVVEALLFYTYYAREVAPYPPQNYDQAVYLDQVYALETRVHFHGIGELWGALWSNSHFSTLLLPIEGAVFGLVFSGARLPQLCVLFVGFCALQLFAFATARKIWGYRSYGLMVLGLILAQGTLWYWAGGLFDFRIDFLAYCLYGIWACAVIQSSFFLDRRWAIGCGLIGALLVLHRFLSVIYVVGVSAGFAGACAIIWFQVRNNAGVARQMGQRLFNLGLSLVALVLVVVPIFIINWAAIYSKYVYGQFVYEKDIRAQEFGISGLVGHLLYYPKSILWDHLGRDFVLASAIGVTGALVGYLIARSKKTVEDEAHRDRGTFLFELIFLVGAIVGPIIVLTIDISKSPVIGGIVGVPFALLVVSVIARIGRFTARQESSPARKSVFAFSLMIFAIGLCHLFDQASRHGPEYAQRQDLKRSAELDKWLVDYAGKNDWPTPKISIDVISSWFNNAAITTSGYEQSGELIEFQPGLGNGGDVMGVDRAEALASLADSDFVVLTTLPKTGVYPFYQKISQYWGNLKAWADKNLINARDVAFDGFTATVYVRPTATVSGISGGWITSSGLIIETLRASLQHFPKIRLVGSALYSVLPKEPAVSARVGTNQEMQTIPASFRRIDQGYEILIDTSSVKLPSCERVLIQLSFDAFFVPKNVGMNEDSRQLVIAAPKLVQLLPTAD
jgi:hypothetical protein